MASMAPLPCERNCTRLALGEDSFCPDCDMILCRDHYDDPAHTCGYNMVYIGRCNLGPILQDIDGDAIQRRIAKLRPGAPFQIKIPETEDDALELSGGFNIHVEVSFADGVEWLVRIAKYNRGEGPSELQKQVLESEALTYKMLREHGVPVAAVHHWEVGEFSKTYNPLCRHMIYDRLLGSSTEEIEVGLADGTMSEEDLRTFAESYAAFSIRMSEMTFEKIGSLAKNEEGEVMWGPLLHGGYPDSLEVPFFGGPFHTLRDAYIHRIDGLIELLKRGLIHRKSPLVHYLAFKEARRLVMADPAFAKRETTFYIRHPDCSGANILSKDFKVVGLIDWEWTGTTTKAAAFASPKWAYNTDAWAAGDNSLTPEEDLLCEGYRKQGRPDLADCVRGGRRYQRLDHLLFNWVPYWGEKEAVGSLNALRGAFTDDDTSLPETLPEWVERAKGMQEGDPELVAVVELDEECRRLRHRRPENVAHEKTVINLSDLLGDLFGRPCEDQIRASST